MALTGSPNLAQSTDQELLRLTPVNVEAFGVFYDRYEDPLLGFLRRATGRADLAADLTAEVFAVALASLDAFRADLGTARAWLFGIARHELAQSWRRLLTGIPSGPPHRIGPSQYSSMHHLLPTLCLM